MNGRRLDRAIRVYALENVRGSSGSASTVYGFTPILSIKAQRNDYHRDRMSEMVVNDQRRSERITTWRVRYEHGKLIKSTMIIKDDLGITYDVINVSEVVIDGISKRLVRRRQWMDILCEVTK